MKTRMKILLLLLFPLLACNPEVDELVGKRFVGFEPRNTLDPSQPNYKWYFKTTVSFTNDSVYINKSSVSIFKDDTLYSASDGGFYNYRGTWKRKGEIEINVIETSCDYCPQEIKIAADGKRRKIIRTLNYNGNIFKEGLLLNGVYFKKS